MTALIVIAAVILVSAVIVFAVMDYIFSHVRPGREDETGFHQE